MTIELHSSIAPVVSAKRSIVNKIKNQPQENIDLKIEIKSLQKSIEDLQSTLSKYKNLIKAVGMNAEKLSSDLNMEFSRKLDNLENLKNLMPDNIRRKEFFITYLESGINILNGTLWMLEKFN